MTVITDETAGAARRRAGLIADLNHLIDSLAVMGGAGIPELVSIQLPAPGDGGYEGKRVWLERVAAAWQTEILPDGMGGHWAEKSFGSVRLVASVACSARGTFDYQARAAAHGLRPSIAQNGATA
jgi:hypothetical protein